MDMNSHKFACFACVDEHKDALMNSYPIASRGMSTLDRLPNRATAQKIVPEHQAPSLHDHLQDITLPITQTHPSDHEPPSPPLGVRPSKARGPANRLRTEKLLSRLFHIPIARGRRSFHADSPITAVGPPTNERRRQPNQFPREKGPRRIKG